MRSRYIAEQGSNDIQRSRTGGRNLEWGVKLTYVMLNWTTQINPFKPEFTIVIFIYYKPRIAVAIIDL